MCISPQWPLFPRKSQGRNFPATPRARQTSISHSDRFGCYTSQNGSAVPPPAWLHNLPLYNLSYFNTYLTSGSSFVLCPPAVPNLPSQPVPLSLWLSFPHSHPRVLFVCPSSLSQPDYFGVKNPVAPATQASTIRYRVPRLLGMGPLILYYLVNMILIIISWLVVLTYK